MAAKSLQDQLIDTAYEIQEQYRDILATRDANRRTLRDLATQGLLSDEQMTTVEELYPRRASRSEEDEAAAAAANN